MNFDEIKQLVQLVKEEDLQEIEIKDENKSIRIEAKRQEKIDSGISNISAQAYSGATSEGSGSNDNELLEIRSPQIGVFYTQPKEDRDDTFVNIGDSVNEKTQVGLVEAMKMFTDVPAGQNGIIEDILVVNGESVEYNQVLMLVRPEEA